MKIEKSFNVQIWVGLKKTYLEGSTQNISLVKSICKRYVDKIGDCVTVTPTDFIYTNGNEKGVVVGFIQYPRFPREEDLIKENAIRLANELMIALTQYRVTITTPYESIMLENENVNR